MYIVGVAEREGGENAETNFWKNDGQELYKIYQRNWPIDLGYLANPKQNNKLQTNYT